MSYNYDVIHNDKFTSELTEVLCEVPEQRQFNAPHHFRVRDVHSKQIVSMVDFQEGPIKEHGLNGLFIPDLLLMCITQLESFQNSDFKCIENSEALHHLYDAVGWLRRRTESRREQGVLGTNKKREDYK